MAGYSNMEPMDESSMVANSPPKEDRSQFKLTGLNNGKKPSKSSILTVQHKKHVEGSKAGDTKSRIFGCDSVNTDSRPMGHHKKSQPQILKETDQENTLPGQACKSNPITGERYVTETSRTASNLHARNLSSNIF